MTGRCLNGLINLILTIFIQKVQTGKNFSKVERGIVRIAEVSAALDVVRFQKNPNRKIDSTPGEINPTYSWMNW